MKLLARIVMLGRVIEASDLVWISVMVKDWGSIIGNLQREETGDHLLVMNKR